MVYPYTAFAVVREVSREAQPLWLIGEFSALLAMRLGKFPNKLRYFPRKYPAACRPSVRLPFGGGCPCRLLARNPHLIIFPFRSVVGGGAVVSVFKGSFARGGRMQGLGEKYYPKHEGGDCSHDGVAA